MARLRINKTHFTKRRSEFIAKIEAASLEASRLAAELVLAQAIVAAPFPEDEERAVLFGDEAQVFGARVKERFDASEESRVRFQKLGGDQMYIRDALMNPEVQKEIIIRHDTSTRIGFNIGNLQFLDQVTKFSWVNSSKKGTYTYVSPHGTFNSFEYGYQQIYTPKNAKFLSPVEGLLADAYYKSINARPMFTAVNFLEVRRVMKEVLGAVKF